MDQPLQFTVIPVEPGSSMKPSMKYCCVGESVGMLIEYGNSFKSVDKEGTIVVE